VRENDDRILQRIARELRRPVPVDPTLDGRVMDDVRALPRHVRRGVWSRLITPRTVKVRPLPWALLAASLVLVAGLAGFVAVRALGEDSAPPVTSLFHAAQAPAAKQRVQFVLVAPTARKVAVVGDFNGWDAEHAGYQATHRGGGVWAVSAQVPAGHHRYSFVVDDSLWMADPTAPRAIDNDFGMPKSAIVVGGSNQ
jgi:hypothetical protein